MANPSEVNWGELPWSYDENGGFIIDKHGNKVCDIRGFGYLTGGLKLSEEEAVETQNAMGKRIVERLNRCPYP